MVYAGPNATAADLHHLPFAEASLGHKPRKQKPSSGPEEEEEEAASPDMGALPSAEQGAGLSAAASTKTRQQITTRYVAASSSPSMPLRASADFLPQRLRRCWNRVNEAPTVAAPWHVLLAHQHVALMKLFIIVVFDHKHCMQAKGVTH